jgi:hypothetical protein
MMETYKFEIGSENAPVSVEINTDMEKETARIEVKLGNVLWNLDDQADKDYIIECVNKMLENF